MKKSLICILLAVMMIFSFAACGDNQTSETTDTVSLAETPTETEPAVTVDRSGLKIAMIGDSLVAGLAGYAVTDEIDFYGSVNLTTQGIFTTTAQGSSIPIIDEIAGDKYDVVVILLGINEVSYETSAWIENYRAVVEGVKERASGAEVWIHAILPVSQNAEDTSQFGVTNPAIAEKDVALKNLAAETGCSYITAASVLGADNGILPDDVASDGIHPKKSYCEIWASFLLDTIKG